MLASRIDLTTLHHRGQEWYREGARGRVQGHASALAWLGQRTDPLAAAWRMVLEGQAWFAQPSGPGLPYEVGDVGEVARRAGADPQVGEVLGLACALGARDALLRFDAAGLDAWIEVHRRVGAEGRRAASEAWRRWLDDHGASFDLDGLAASARDAQDAELAIEATVLRALFAAGRGDLEESVKIARRASRMARTEALPQPQYLANLVLARLRRLAGRPHLSVHILSALLRVAPRAWWLWMSWERAIAGGDDEGWSAEPARAVIALGRAAARADRPRLEAALEAAGALAHVSAFAPESAALGALIDPDRPVPPDLEAWVEGRESDRTPYGLHGLCSHHPDPALTGEPVWVVVGPERARRFLAIGLPLLSDVEALDPGRRRRGRTDAAIAELALRGDAEEEAFFTRLYGFPYQASVHRGARDTLYHRVRDRVSGCATLRREEGRLGLDVARAFAFPDPRCAPPPENAILAILAREGASTAKQAADALGLPVRTAQHALKALASDGFCRVEKVGRQLRYHVEDTTFVEPTQQ